MANRTLVQWQLIIEAHKNSDLSVAAYCKQHSINEKSFYNRRAKLEHNIELAKPAFIKAEPIRPESPQVLTLKLGEATLTMPAGASLQWIAGLVKAVAS